jgi:hypothetical protein
MSHRFNVNGGIAVALALATAIGFGTQANATTFFASGTFADGAVLGGTLSVDTTLGTITSSNLSVSVPDAFTFINIVGQGDNPAPLFYSVTDRNAANTEDFDFGLPLHSLIGYAGGPFCSNATAPACTASNLFDLTTSTAGAVLSAGELSLTPVPVPLIGRGLPVLLAFGGILFGAKLLERRKRHRLQLG